MKDKNGIELVKGDLVFLTIDTPVEYPSQLVIFKEQVERTYEVTEDGEARTKLVCDIYYYPITPIGLEVATYDSGATTATLHREKEYKATNVEPKHLIKGTPSTLRGYKKELYDDIVALL